MADQYPESQPSDQNQSNVEDVASAPNVSEIQDGGVAQEDNNDPTDAQNIDTTESVEVADQNQNSLEAQEATDMDPPQSSTEAQETAEDETNQNNVESQETVEAEQTQLDQEPEEIAAVTEVQDAVDAGENPQKNEITEEPSNEAGQELTATEGVEVVEEGNVVDGAEAAAEEQVPAEESQVEMTAPETVQEKSQEGADEPQATEVTGQDALEESTEEKPAGEDVLKNADAVQAVGEEPQVDAEGAPAVTNEAPAVTDEAPAVTDEAQAVTEEAQAVTDEAPAVTDEAQAVTDEAQAVTEEAPAVTDEAPAVTDEAPAVTDEAQAVTDEAPAVTDEAQAVTEEAPAVTDEAQAVTGETQEITEEAQAATEVPGAQEAEADQAQEDIKQEIQTPDEQGQAEGGEFAEEKAQEEQGPDDTQIGTEVQEPKPNEQKDALIETKHTVNLDATATVKFVLMPSGQVVTLACALGQTLDALKTHFAFELKMPSTLIMLMFDGRSMPDTTTLADLGVGPNGTIQLEMQSADPVNTPLKAYRPRQEYHMPDVITVRVMTEDCEAKDVVVEIERSRSKKPFLGGFRNKNTGIEFHNASAQTMQKPRPPPTMERFCRDTQTCEQKNIVQQTTNTTSTQMTGVGVYISNIEDKLIAPGKYFSADDHCARILRNVIILQKYYRRWLAKRYVTKLKDDKAKRLEWERQEELRKKKEKEERIKRDYARRINPKSKADFDMLLHCLEKWRVEEMERINTTLDGAERKAALCMLLDQETELLSAIERHKNDANKDNKDKRIMSFLDKAASPKKWQGHDGKLTYMDTPYTIRAKELRDIYNSINMKYLTQDERLDVLLTLKHTVKEHDCKLTQEIIELIDREADLLMRGVKEGNLTGLRKRISTLFLQYIKTPIFNPEAANLLKVPQDPSTLRKNINYCHSCGSYLPSTEFFITSNSRNVGRCRHCEKIENDGRQREDHTYYRVMLKSLRKSEEAMQDGSSISFLLQEHDLRYLVENIWSNQSVLSAWDDLYDLVLVRWDKHQEWSPWNCILLTHDEAEAHKKLFSLEEGYGQVFIHKVTQKHNFARNYFSRLPGMSELLRQKLGSKDLSSKSGPAVAGHSVAKAQKV